MSPPLIPLTTRHPHPRLQAERLKEMLKQKYSRQKEETDEMEKRRNKLEAQMDQVCIPIVKTTELLMYQHKYKKSNTFCCACMYVRCIEHGPRRA